MGRVVAEKMSDITAAVARASRKRKRDAQVEDDIGLALRAAYESAVQEPVPPALLDLLDKLR